MRQETALYRASKFIFEYIKPNTKLGPFSYY